MIVVECPHCFTKWYCHGGVVGDDAYRYFLYSIYYGTQKHFTKFR